MRSFVVILVAMLCCPDRAVAEACEYAGLRYSDGAEICIMGKHATCKSDGETAAWDRRDEACGLRIEIASARYGAADQWCSAYDRVAETCSGRWDCLVSVDDVGTTWTSYAEREKARDRLLCGPLSKVRRTLSIAWYCSDGETYLGQFRVAVPDGADATLSCGGSLPPR